MTDENQEIQLLKQVVALEVMQANSAIVLKEIRDEVKSLNLETRNYRQNMDTRIGALERFQERYERSKIDERIDSLEAIERKFKTGWAVIVVLVGTLFAIFIDDIKRILHS